MQVDATIGVVIGDESDTLDQRLARLGAAVLSHCTGAHETVNTSSDVFEGLRSRQERRFLAICLLRVLAKRRDAFDDHDIRVATMRLFDEVLNPDVYKLANVNVGQQGHEKLAALGDFVASTEGKLDAVIADIEERTDFAAVHAAVLQQLRAESVSALMGPFWGRAGTPARVNEVLTAVREFEAADGEALVDAYRRAIEAVNLFAGDARKTGTVYGGRLGQMAEALRRRVVARYGASGAARPAQLELRLSPKKYPVASAATVIDLLVEVTNAGPGFALDTQVRIEKADGLSMLDHEVFLGALSPKTTTVVFRAEVESLPKAAAVYAAVEWRNADGQRQHAEETLMLDGQDVAVDWADAQRRNPFELEPVSSEEQLVGRGAILDALTSMSTSATVGSAVIRGQKRVGKTSIVRALQSRLLRTDASIGVAFLEVGPYGGSSVASTVERLASQVCRELRGTIDDDKGVDPPVFTDGSAVAVVEFVDELRQRNPNKQWLLVLDEFDELPPNVFGAEDLVV